jgi:hypothetical protein
MLYNLKHKLVETPIIHQCDYDRWRGALTEQEHEGAKAHIHQLIDEAVPARYFRSSYRAGSHWDGTPLQPLYEKSGNYSEMQAGLFFGVLVWQIMVEERPNEKWTFWPAHPEDPIRSVTYFLR